MGALQVGLMALGGASCWEAIVQIAEQEERLSAYQRARAYAWTLHKPLLVVGMPRSQGMLVLGLPPRHPCGDVCVDLDPRVLEQCCNGRVADIRSLPFPNGKFGAAFCSHVLEHMPDLDSLQQAVSELRRVADHVEVVLPHKFSITAWLAPGHRLWVKDLGSIIEATERGTGKTLTV